MTVAEYCVFGVVALYLLTIVPIKWIGYRQYDNAKPRDPAFYQDAIRARALGAHQNGIEAFPFFAAAVLLAYALQKTDAHSALGAQIYVWARLLYIPAYVLGIPFLRTLIWAASLAGILMVLSAYWPGM